MRIVGLDLGEKRIGVAAADDRTRVAVPVATIEANGDPVTAITLLVAEQNPDELVVGIPLSLTGAIGPQAELTMQVVEALTERLALPIHTWDERLTTAQARRDLRGRPQAGKLAKMSVDAIAATILLQAFLDSRRSRQE